MGGAVCGREGACGGAVVVGEGHGVGLWYLPIT